MSAYDEGGKIRALQLQFLCEFLKQEKEAGNYVILGGDFNHDIAHSSGLDGESESYFETDEKHPEWVNYLDESALPEGYHIGTSLNAPTCRAAEMPYTKIYSEERGDREDEKGKYYVSNYTVVIDGFICSENVKIKNVENLDLQFLYSDHNPVVMNFTLDI